MNKVTVKKTELLEKLKANLVLHKQEFDDTHRGYLKQAQEAYDAALTLLIEEDKVTQYFDLDAPTSHAEEYKRAIAMLEMDIDEEVELTEGEFDRYVLDNWRWKNDFKMSNTKYAG